MGKKDFNGKFLKTDDDFVESLLENQGIAVVQGSAFGLNGFFRISYATSMNNLKKAMEKIKTKSKEEPINIFNANLIANILASE